MQLDSGRNWACTESEECVKGENGEERGERVQKLQRVM